MILQPDYKPSAEGETASVIIFTRKYYSVDLNKEQHSTSYPIFFKREIPFIAIKNGEDIMWFGIEKKDIVTSSSKCDCSYCKSVKSIVNIK